MSTAANTNALKHGLFAESPILPGEDPAPFDVFRNQFVAEFAPATVVEQQLTADLANLRWRLLRCQSLENAILADPALSAESQINALAKFSLYEHRLTRKFTNTLKQLQALQIERKAKEEAEMQYAVAIAAECKAEGLPFDPSEFGFVFSAQAVQLQLKRQQAFQAATANQRAATRKGGR